jgi:hypothetical protein
LREITGPLFRNQRCRQRLEAWLRRREGVGYGVKSRDDALDIAINCRRWPVKGDRGDRRRGVVADAGERQQRCRLIGKPPAMPIDDGARAGMEVAGPSVIAEPLPELQDFNERCCGEHRNVGPARHESVEIWADSRYRRLLQHDLAEPHEVGVGPAPGRCPPWQVAAVAIVPGEKSCRIRRS